MSEAEIRKQIRDWLDTQGIFCWPNLTTGIPDGKGGFWKHPMPGIADIGGVLPNGRALAIECKVEGHKTDKDRLASQMKFLSRVNVCGGLGFFAYSLQDVKDRLQPILSGIPMSNIDNAKNWFIETKQLLEATRLSATSRQKRNTPASRNSSQPKF